MSRQKQLNFRGGAPYSRTLCCSMPLLYTESTSLCILTPAIGKCLTRCTNADACAAEDCVALGPVQPKWRHRNAVMHMVFSTVDLLPGVPTSLKSTQAAGAWNPWSCVADYSRNLSKLKCSLGSFLCEVCTECPQCNVSDLRKHRNAIIIGCECFDCRICRCGSEEASNQDRSVFQCRTRHRHLGRF